MHFYELIPLLTMTVSGTEEQYFEQLYRGLKQKSIKYERDWSVKRPTHFENTVLWHLQRD